MGFRLCATFRAGRGGSGDLRANSQTECRRLPPLGAKLARIAALPAVAALLAAPVAADRVDLAAEFTDFTYVGRDSGPAPGPGFFRNPVIPGSHPDPSIVRVGRDYYLAASSFTAWPGLPIFHSRDLVRWTPIGHAVTRRAQMAFDGLDAAWQGIYAPDLKHHRGRFYLLSTCYGCGGNFVMTAASAAGPWSAPTWLPFAGIDPSIFFDDDGRAYVLNNGLPPGGPRYDGHRAIWLQEIDLATLTMTGPRGLLVDGGVDLGSPPFWIEGPHLLKRAGRYVLIAAQGGTKERHAAVAFGSDALRGPYRPGPDNPILTQVGLDPRRPDPVSSAGHADLVRTAAGDWWAVFLGNRPYGPHDLLTNLGREVFLLPVVWRDGWPTILSAGQPVPLVLRRPGLPPDRLPVPEPFIERERFASPTLGRDWTWIGTPTTTWWRVGGGRLSVDARPVAIGDAGQPSFIGVRQRHHRAEVTVRVRFQPCGPDDRAGLVAFTDPRHFLALTIAGREGGGRTIRLERRAGKADSMAGTLVASAPLDGPAWRPVALRVTARDGVYRFSFATVPNRWISVGGDQDGSVLSIKRTGGFVGSLAGMYAYRSSREAAAVSSKPRQRTTASKKQC